MSRYFILSLLILYQGACPKANSQNLVANHSFENVIKETCYKIGPPDNIADYLAHWYSPTPGTSDLLTNDTIKCPIVPALRQDWPRTGTHAVGLVTYAANPLNSPYVDGAYREYIQTKLIQPLSMGHRYYAEFYVRFPSYGQQDNLVYSNNIGMLFTTDTLYIHGDRTELGRPILAQPQINETQMITGVNWRKISGYFIADQAYQYLTIGNFFDNAHTLFSQQSADGSSLSYHTIDDVVVVPAEEAPLMERPNLGPDLYLCPGQTVSFALSNDPQLTYEWQDSSTSSAYTVRQGGVYWVKVTMGVTTYSDTIQVRYPAPITLPNDTILCQGEQLILAPVHAATQFIWSDGSRNPTLAISKEGQYSVSARIGNCTVSDTINVQTLICPGEVPNVFTPNGDGKNDTFVIDHIDRYPWRLEIYNRWGTKVYENDSYNNDWQGNNLPAGTYYYYLSNKELNQNRKGWITLIR